jgi:YD repeat-containing protein
MKSSKNLFGFLLTFCTTSIFAGWNAGTPGCFADFETAKMIACATNNPDTTSNPGVTWWYRDSCITTAVPNFVVQAHGLDIATGTSVPFSYAANLQLCAPAADAVANIQRASKSLNAGQLCAGNPIFPLLGSKNEFVNTGWSLGGLGLTLTYDSGKQMSAAAMGVSAHNLGAMPSFGPLWESSFHKYLQLGNGGFGITAFRGNGHTVSFRYNNISGKYIADADVNEHLTLIPDVLGGFRLFDANANTLEDYSINGLLRTVTDASGNVLTYTYSTGASENAPEAGYLLKINDNSGRFLIFTYMLPTGGVAAIDGLVSTVTNTAGQTILFSYNAGQNLSMLSWPDGAVKRFVYENTDFPWALTGVVDELGIRYSTFIYDSAGRAISTEHSGGVNNFSVTYSTPPRVSVTQSIEASTQTPIRSVEWVPAINPVLYKPDGQHISLSSSLVLGYPLFSGSSQSAGSGCGASNNASTFDTAGNLVLKDDFQGNRSCYSYDTKNQEVARIEGLSTTIDCASVLPIGAAVPTNARKVTTTWHPDWRISQQIVYPGSISSNVFNGQPDPFNANQIASCTAAANLPNGKPIPLLCKQVIQATLTNGSIDTTVPNIVNQYTYDAFGHMLTVTDTLIRVTAYSYYASTLLSRAIPNQTGHTVGDLQSITDPSGKVTTFGLYDAVGHVLQMTDPKGVVTQLSYTPRGWVSTASTTAPGGAVRATTYSYDAVGQVIGIANPDGTALNFNYDAAHRLAGAKDARGNMVAYTLDNMGNRIAEQVADPTGNLQRSIARSFDALNRLQQVTGAQQ